MRINEYQHRAGGTAIYPGRGFGPLGLAYTTLGLVSEITEFEGAYETDDLEREGGDILWYVSQVAFEAGLSLGAILGAVEFRQVDDYLKTFGWSPPSDSLPGVHPVTVLRQHGGVIADIVKKVLRDEGGQISAERQQVLGAALVTTVLALGSALQVDDLTLDGAATRNLAKLADRQQRDVIHGAGDNR